MSEASLVLMTCHQAEVCINAVNIPMLTVTSDFSRMWENLGVSREDAELFPDSRAPEGYLWVIVSAGDFAQYTNVLNECTL